jgi:signal transduction histidine kinase
MGATAGGPRLLKSLRASGLERPMCQHAVQFYESESFLYEKVSRFVNTSLAAGESAIVIASKAHRQAIEKRVDLSSLGIGSRAQFISLDAEETLSRFMVDGWPDPQRFADVIGGALRRASADGALGVRAFGEMVALLCAAGKPEAAVRLEGLWNNLAREHDFSLLCAYPMDVFQGEDESRAFHHICAAHSHVCASEEYENRAADSDHFHRATALLQQKAKALEYEVARRNQTEIALSKLAAHQERIREDERKRIAREIHDELGSVLTGIKAYVSVAIDRAKAEGRAVDPQLADASDLADTAIETVRRVITDLRPSVLDELGIWVALEWYAGQIEKQTGLSCSLTIDARVAAMTLVPETSIVLFRIVQEALTNAIRHAGASRITVRVLLSDQSLIVEVVDDGKGLEAAQVFNGVSWGIAGMQERARHVGGEIKITGITGCGTAVVFRLPLEQSNDR